MKRYGIAMLGLVTATACGAGELPDAARRGLPIAFGLPRVAAVNIYFSRSMAVEAVYQATTLSGGASIGQVVNTGTLAPAYGGYRYSPQPSDKLVVLLGEQRHEFVILEAQGNAQALTSSAWLMSPHVLRYRHLLPGQGEAEVAARYDGARFSVEVSGWHLQAGTRYELELSASGQASGTRDYHGQETATEYKLTGQIRGDGLVIEVDEHHASTLVAANNLRLLPSQRGSATRFDATLNNVLRAGDVELRLRDVRVQTESKARGGQASAGMTGLSGEVLQNGQPLGRCVLEAGQAFLQTAEGPIALDLPLPGAG